MGKKIIVIIPLMTLSTPMLVKGNLFLKGRVSLAGVKGEKTLCSSVDLVTCETTT